MSTQKFMLAGGAGQLECALNLPKNPPRGIALIAHPHPLYGGTMDNKVIYTLSRTFLALDYIAVRMNFRGVGASEGEHDHARGETDDMYTLMLHMREQYPDLPLALAGFSFGTVVQAELHKRLLAEGRAVQRMVFVGTAAIKWHIPEVPQNTIVIHGEHDETIPLTDVFDWARPQELPVWVIPGADHFFHRKLQFIRSLVTQMWDGPIL
ncbi:alpha/beta hydrolase [Massilia sp. W12]|uniref:alpha/beta hydrolase n=1 Tax=Massilia sp. W12 TaxID=3126507 RepID=UPI0030CEBC20